MPSMDSISPRCCNVWLLFNFYDAVAWKPVLALTVQYGVGMFWLVVVTYGRWERGEAEITMYMNVLVHNLIAKVPGVSEKVLGNAVATGSEKGHK